MNHKAPILPHDLFSKHLEETLGSLFAVVTVSYMFEVVFYSALSAIVGALLGHLTKKYLIPMLGRLFKAIHNRILKLFK